MSSFGLPSARAEASRKNGAKSNGPKTPEGKARSAQNALKHGLRAQKYVVLPEEDAAAYKALEKAIVEELAPEGALQTVLAQRVVAATWRLARAERLEAELFAIQGKPILDRSGPGYALIRDCNGPRSFDTLLRYRGGTLAELWRALRMLEALQAERQTRMREAQVGEAARPDKPERRSIPRESVRPADASETAGAPVLGWVPPWPLPASGEPVGPAPVEPAPWARPIEPETRRKPALMPTGPRSLLAGIRQRCGDSLLTGTALASVGRPGGA